MSHEGNVSNYSEDEYDDESFDNESIDEVSDEEAFSQEMSEEAESIDETQKSDKSSIEFAEEESAGDNEDEYEEENEDENDVENGDENDYEPDDDNNDKNIRVPSTSDSPTENNKLVLKNENNKENTVNQNQSPAQPNCHEIDESDSEAEVELEITSNFEYLRIQNANNTSKTAAKNVSKFNEQFDREDDYMDDRSEMGMRVTSQTPTSFNSDNHAFHMDIIKKRTSSSTSILSRSRNSNRISLSFSNDRMREIERHNQILLRKILTQKPSKTNFQTCPNIRTTSAAINRKKQQRQIDLDNLVLKRKIEAISQRRKTSLY